MFIGHFALALAAKSKARRQSLGMLTLAAEWVDLIWPVLLLLGWETVAITPNANPFLSLDFTSYPWTHSLVMGVLWALLLGGVVLARSRDAGGAFLVGGLVISHWFLDFATHRPDMPLWPGGLRIGLGLWRSVPATLVVEGAMFVIGSAIYLRSTRARDRTGRLATWGYLLFLGAVYAVTAKGTPPPNVRVLAFTGLALWLLPLWAWWADRHREPVPVEA
jgi:hypothetical protein